MEDRASVTNQNAIRQVHAGFQHNTITQSSPVVRD